MLRLLRFWFAASAICLSSCMFDRSPRLPSDLSTLADRTERIDFDFEPPANRVLPLLRLRTGTARLGQFEVRSSFHRAEPDDPIFHIIVREGRGLLMNMRCIYHSGFLNGRANEYWYCSSKSSGFGFTIDVSDGILMRIVRSGQIRLTSPLPLHPLRAEGSTVTVLVSGMTGPGRIDDHTKTPLAAIVAREHRVALFIPRDDELREPALAAFLLAILIKSPYLGLAN